MLGGDIVASFGIDYIKSIIPHREPFLFLDEILELEAGKYIVAKKLVKSDEFWVEGHFPNFAVCPGVIAIEMLAQAGAVCILSVKKNKGKIAFFGGIKKARFKKNIFPGDEVILTVDVVKTVKNIGIGKSVATVKGKVVLLAELSFAVK